MQPQENGTTCRPWKELNPSCGSRFNTRCFMAATRWAAISARLPFQKCHTTRLDRFDRPPTIPDSMDTRKKCFAEFLGTFALVFAGTGAIVINDVSGGAVTH